MNTMTLESFGEFLLSNYNINSIDISHNDFSEAQSRKFFEYLFHEKY